MGLEEKPLPSPSRPEGKRRRRDGNLMQRTVSEEMEGATRIILTPVRASPSQQQHHQCDMILTPLRKSVRLMKEKKEDLLVDKLMDTGYAYANNSYLNDKTIDG